MRLFWGPGALILVGCAFQPNLGDGNIVCGAQQLCPPGYVCRSDQRCWRSAPGAPGDLGDVAGADLAMSIGDLGHGAAVDMASPPDAKPVCVSSARICPNSGASAACVPFAGGFTQDIDRTCPPGSQCSTGYCQPPSSPLACTSTAGCAALANNVCDPFVVSQGGTLTIQGYCAGRFGTSTGNCTAVGFDSTCASGYCISTNGNNGSKMCMTLCAQTSDCPTGSTCASRLVNVEGLTTTISACGK